MKLNLKHHQTTLLNHSAKSAMHISEIFGDINFVYEKNLLRSGWKVRSEW